MYSWFKKAVLFLPTKYGVSAIAVHLLLALILLIPAIGNLDPSSPSVIGLAILFGGITPLAVGGRKSLGLYLLLVLLTSPTSLFYRGPDDVALFHIAFASFATCALIFSRAKVWAQGIVLAVIIIIFLLPENILGGYRFLIGKDIGQSQILAICNTNWDEIKGYIEQHEKAIPLLMSFIAGFIILPIGMRKWTPKKLTAADYGFLWVVINVTFFALLKTHAFGYDRPLFYVMMTDSLTQERRYETVAKERKAHPEIIQAQKRDDFQKGLYVVVIGESANRHHLHLYGYDRETTPLMDKRRNNMAIFSDAIASYSGTLFSLRRALTLASVESGKEYPDEGMYSLIEILRSAGLKTYWLSNQSKWGLWGIKIATIASGADHVLFLHDKAEMHNDIPLVDGLKAVSKTGIVEKSGRITSVVDFMGMVNGPDEALLDAIDQAITNEDKSSVLFVHLMGSHFPYLSRYPDGFKEFSSEKDGFFQGSGIHFKNNDSYDTTIAYTDYVIDQIVQKLEKKGGVSSLLYFSDHGESSLVGLQHDPADFTPGNVDVPFFMWFSDGYKKAYPSVLVTANKNKDKPFMMDQLTKVAMDWIHINGPFYKAANSLLNDSYTPTHRLTQDGKVDYDTLQKNYCQIVKEKTGFELKNCRGAPYRE